MLNPTHYTSDRKNPKHVRYVVARYMIPWVLLNVVVGIFLFVIMFQLGNHMLTRLYYGSANTFTHNDNSGTEFGGGTHYGTAWDSVNSIVAHEALDELPNSAGSGGWIDMTGNQLLLHFDEAGAATSFADDSGNSRNGSCSGGNCPTSGVEAKIDKVLDFDGTDDYVDLSSHVAAFSSQATGTVGFWYKSPFSDDTCQTPISYSDVSADSSFFISVGDCTASYSDESARLVVRNAGSTSLELVYRKGHAFLIDQKWHYITFVMGSSSNAFYVDGEAVSVTYATGSSSTSSIMFSTVSSADSFLVGDRNFSGASYDTPVRGQMDEVSVWTTELTATNIKTIYDTQRNDINTFYELPDSSTTNQWTNTEDIELLLHLNEASGATSFSDTSGNSLNASCSTCPIAGSPSRLNAGIELNGTDEYIESSEAVDDNMGNAFTYMAWIYPHDTTSAHSIISNYDGGGTSDGANFRINGDDLDVFLFDSGSGNYIGRSTTGNDVSENKWQHVAVTWSGTFANAAFTLFVNGNETDDADNGAGTVNTFDASPDPLRIGANQGNSGTIEDYFDGKIDEIAAFSRALSPTEIRNIFDKQNIERTSYFESIIVNGTSDIGWHEIRFSPDRPLYKQIPSATETGYTSGNISLSNNVLHMTLGEFNSADDISPVNIQRQPQSGFDTAAGGIVGRSASVSDYDYINYPHREAYNLTTEGTISAWIKINHTGAFNRHLVDKVNGSSTAGRDSTSSVDGYEFYTYNGVLTYKVHNAGTSASVDFVSNTTDNSWHHVVAVHDGTSLRVYFDGDEDAETVSAVTPGISLEDLTIGNDSETNIQTSFEGQFDELEIYNVALSAADIAEIYNSGSPVAITQKTNQVLALPFSEISYTDTTPAFEDKSSSSNDGSCVVGKCPALHYDGIFDSAADFDGTDDYIDIADSSSLDFTSADAISLSAWVHPDDFDATGGIITRWECGGQTQTEFQLLADSSSKVTFSTYVNPTTNDTNSIGSLVAQKWNHVVATFDNSTDDVNIYLNGALDTNATHTGSGLANGNLAIRIGGRYCGSNDLNFDGKIDEAMIFDRILSAAEVEDIYQRKVLRSQFQVRSCDDAACSGERFVGPDGTGQSFYSELLNATATPPTSLMSLFNVPANQYFQYRIILESDEATTGWGIEEVGAASLPLVTVTTPVTVQTDSIPMSYTLSGESGTTGITVEYSVADGAWTAATTSGSTSSLTVSLAGTAHSITWVSDTDLPNVRHGDTRVRITPTTGTAGATSAFTVNNLQGSIFTDDDNGASEFGGGTKTNIQWDAGNTWIELDASGNSYSLPDNSVSTGWTDMTDNILLMHLDEIGTEKMLDATSNNHDGRALNAADTTASGHISRAGNFDGTNDYVNVGDDSAFQFTYGSSFSISAWVNPALNSSEDVIIGNGYGSTRGYYLAITTANKARITLIDDGSNSRYAETSALTAGWNHVVAVWNGTSLTTYLNGSADTTTGSTGTPANITSSSDLTIGYAPGATSQFFSGQIDMLGVYNAALSSGTVTTLYNSGTGTSITGSETNLVAGWNMDETTWDWTDSSTTGNDFTANPGTTGTPNIDQITLGKVKAAYEFDGTNDYLVSNSNTGISGAAERTIMGWFKVDAFSGGDGTWMAPFSIGGCGSNQLMEFLVNNGGTLYAHMWGTNYNVGPIAANQWFHGAITYDGKIVRVYVNGHLRHQQVLAINTTNSPLTIAGSCTQTYRNFNGTVDEVALFDAELNQKTISNIFDKQRPAYHGTYISTIKDASSSTTWSTFSWLPERPVYAPLPDSAGAEVDYAAGNIDMSGVDFLFHFDSLGGALDIGSNQYNLIPLGDTTSSASGKLSRAASFDGTDDWFQGPPVEELSDTSKFSIVGWFYQDTIDQQRGMFEMRPVNSTSYYLAAETSNTGNLYTYVRDNDTSYAGFDYSTVVSAGTWFHYAMVFDGTQTGNANRLKVYIDGSEQTQTFSGTIPAQSPSYAGSSFNIGGRNQSFNEWDGLIDEFAIYSDALTSGEVASLYNSGSGYAHTGAEADLVAAWHFDETAYQISDSSGNNRHAQAEKGVQLVDGVIGKAFDFDSTDDYVEVANVNTMLPEEEITISFWQFTDVVQSQSSFAWNGATFSNRINAHVPWSDNVVYWDFGNFATTGRVSVSMPDEAKQQWAHFAFVASEASDKMEIWINGTKRASTTTNDTIDTSIAEQSFFIGALNASTNRLNGKIDEFALFDSDIGQTAIENIYKRGALKMRFQLRTCNDAACSGETFIGPYGTGASYFDENYLPSIGRPTINIESILSANRYAQYTVDIATLDTAYSPELNAVTVSGFTSSDPVAAITDPVGSQSGDITISYTLSDPESDSVDIIVEYSDNGGSSFNTATQGTGGDGTASLTTSPGGTAHTFVWDSLTDTGSVRQDDVQFRITPITGLLDTTSNFTVDNDATKPKMTNMVFSDFDTLEVTFDETLLQSAATTITNYTLTSDGSDNGVIAITNISTSNGSVYYFDLNQAGVCNEYTLVANNSNIKDDSLAQNTIDPNFDTQSQNNAANQNTTFTTPTTIDDGDTSYKCWGITVDNTTLTVNGEHVFQYLTLQNSANLTHDLNTTSDFNKIDIVLSGDLTVNTGTTIDVDQKGCPGDYIFNEGASLCSTSINGTGEYGSHGGAGFNASHSRINDYIDDPQFPGGASDINEQEGGGVIRISAANIVNNGTISADGQLNDASGGSIKLVANSLISGTGTITADGGGNGSGGRIALYYATSTFSEASITADNNGSGNSGPGTIFFRDTTAVTNRALIKNGGTDTEYTTIKDSFFQDYASSSVDLEVADARLILNEAMNLKSVTIKSGGEIRHSVHTTTDFYKVDLTLSGDLDVQSGGVLEVSERGCPGDYNFNESSGFCDNNINGGTGEYGSHAGPGLNATTALVYGDYDNPTAPGGASDVNEQEGGGVVIVTAEDIIVNGDIKSNGQANDGAGGSINLTTTGTLSGSGTITANGGGTGINGAGGRIAINYGTLTLSESNILARSRYGRGTIYLKQTSSNPKIYIGDGTEQAQPNYPTPFRQEDFSANYFSPTPTFDSIVIDRAYVELETDITVANGITVKRTGQTLSTNTDTLYIDEGVTITGDLDITTNGHVTHPISTASSGDYKQLNFTVVGDITIDASSSIDVSGRGCPGDYHFDTVNLDDCSININATGEYGSHGGAGLNAALSRIYDSIDVPLYPGGGSDVNERAGGGVIRITATNIINNGTIKANYQPGSTDAAGGSIDLNITGSLSGSGSITANGLNGGGGRVSVEYATTSFTESSIQARTGSLNGGTGTVYISDTTAGTNKVILENNSQDNDRSTIDPSSDFTGPVTDELIIRNGRLILLGSNTFNDVTVENGGEISHPLFTTVASYKVDLTADELDIQSGAIINVDQRGCPGDYTYNEGAGLCNTSIVATNEYASHGGPGFGATISRVYGDIDNPIAPGGGSDINEQEGGGVVIISADNITVNGSIDADGQANDGAGGSINLTTTGTISGAGSITANGGGSGVNGGGGRVALRYGTLTFPVANIEAESRYGRGTVFLKQTSANPKIYIGNGTELAQNSYPTPFRQQDFTTGYFSPTPTFDSIVIDRAYVELYTDVTVANGITVKRTGQVISTNTDTLYVDTGVTITGDVSVETNGHLSHPASTSSSGDFEKLEFTIVGDLTIDSSSTIDVSGRGCPLDYAFDKINFDDCSTYTQGTSSYGSHGGVGFNDDYDDIYDSIDDPQYPGDGSDINERSGGGVIRITATNITNNGTIKANQQPSTNEGAGGSIKLVATDTLAGSGSITADSNAGAGGRIAIYYGTSTFPEANVQARTASTNGGAGTVYLKNTSSNAEKIIIRNNGADNDRSFIDDSMLTTATDTNIDIEVDGARLTFKDDGTPHTWKSLYMYNNAELSHEPSTTSVTNRLQLTVSGDIDIESGSIITAVDKGCPAKKLDPTANSNDGLCNLTPDTFGSHGGFANGFAQSDTYGTPENPFYPGSGSSSNSRTGGGVIILSADNYDIDGTIRADGTHVEAAGGAVKLTASGNFTGTGTIEADGGSAGGGGRVALIYRAGSGTNTMTLTNITANGYSDSDPFTPGTVYLDAMGTDLVTKTGGLGGDVTITYKLWQDDTSLVASSHGIEAIYSSDGGSTWSTAVDGGGASEGKSSLSASAYTGTQHTFVWDASGVGGASALLQLRSTLNAIGQKFQTTILLNSPPTASNVSVDADAANINLTDGTTTAVECTATVVDTDGCSDLSTISSVFYRSGVGSGASDDDNNHYSVTCVQDSGTCTGGADTDATYTCTIDVEYHADPTTAGTYAAENWICEVTPTDGAGPGTGDSDDIEMQTLAALSATSSLNYGTLQPGANTGTSNQTVTITNTGNVQIDTEVDGTAMSCTSGTIPVANQKWGQTSVSQNYSVLPNSLSTSATEYDYDIPKEVSAASTQDTYWGISLPTGISGSCSGTITLGAVDDIAND